MLRKTGYHVITKDIKYIKVNLKELIYNGKSQQVVEHFDTKLNAKIDQVFKELKKLRIT